ncbi:MAG: prefoldin subunit alpha [Nanoarchaeota archaeon]
MNQEQLIRIQLMEQEANQLNQQLQLVEENVKEFRELIESLNEIGNGKEILVNLGKKLYTKVEIKDDKLIVDVGKGNFVKKTIPDTKEIINNQIEKLSEIREEIMKRLEVLQEEINFLILEIEKEQKEQRNKKR